MIHGIIDSVTRSDADFENILSSSDTVPLKRSSGVVGAVWVYIYLRTRRITTVRRVGEGLAWAVSSFPCPVHFRAPHWAIHSLWVRPSIRVSRPHVFHDNLSDPRTSTATPLAGKKQSGDRRDRTLDSKHVPSMPKPWRGKFHERKRKSIQLKSGLIVRQI